MGVFVDYLIFSLLLSLKVGVIPSHMVSFFGATIFNFFLNAHWAFAKTARFNNQSQWQLYTSFLIVCVLSLFLRGAVLAVLTEAAGWSPRIAIFFAIAAAAIANFVGSAFFVFPPQIARTTANDPMACLCNLCGPLFVVAATGLYGSDQFVSGGGLLLELRPAHRHRLPRPSSHGRLADLVGNPPLGESRNRGTVSGLSLLADLLHSLCTDWVEIYSEKRRHLYHLMFLAALPVYFGFGFFMTPDAPLCAAWAGGLYFLERALVNRQSKAWFGVGICLGLGMLSKYTIALLVPAAVLFILLDKESRHWLRRPEPLSGLASGPPSVFPGHSLECNE